VTLAGLSALFVDGKVDDRGKVVDDIEAIFEADLHVVLRSFLLHPALVVDCIGALKVEAVVVLLMMLAWDQFVGTSVILSPGQLIASRT
jgi:hypothetical protein